VELAFRLHGVIVNNARGEQQAEMGKQGAGSGEQGRIRKHGAGSKKQGAQSRERRAWGGE